MGRIDLLDGESGYGVEDNGHGHHLWDRPGRDIVRHDAFRITTPP